MNNLRGFAALFVAVLPILVHAQTEEQAKQKEIKRAVLIERLFSESQSLRLGENRAILLSRLGNAVWNVNAEQARSLYAQAVNELLNAQSIAEMNGDRSGPYQDLLSGSNTRPNVLNAIAAHDAEFALRTLYATRPRIIAEALDAVRVAAKKGRGLPGGNRFNIAQNEINLEHSLIARASQQNPELAVARLRDALKSGLSGMTLNLLYNLARYDEASANAIADEILGKIISKGFMKGEQPDHESINFATSIISGFLQQNGSSARSIRFDESKIKTLAEKLILNQIRMIETQRGWVNPQFVQFAEKLAPSLVERISGTVKTQEERNYGGPGAFAARKFIEQNQQPEELLMGAKNFPAQFRGQIYQSAAGKLVERGEYGAAVAILTENLSDGELENAVDGIKGHHINRLMNNGQFAEAEALIGEMNANNRISYLISLARAMYNRNPEANRPHAAALLDKVRSQFPAEIETSTDLNSMTQLISAYAEFDPPQAFREFNPLIPKFNEVSDAYVIVNAFQGGWSVRQGEYSLSNGYSSGFYIDESMIMRLAAVDFNQTLAIIDKISRRETRILLTFRLLESGNF